MKLSIGQAWVEASAFLMREARLVAPVALALFALPSALLNWAYPAGKQASASGGAMLGLLLVFVAAMIGQMTIVQLSIGWHGSIGEAIGKVSKRVPSLIGAAVLVFAPLLLVFSIAIAAVLVAAGITDPATATPEAMMKLPSVSWLVMLFVLLILFVGVRMFPMSAIAANEQAGPIGLLKRSWALTRGQVGRILVLVLLLLLVVLVLNGAVTAVVGSVARLMLGEPLPFNLAALVIALAGGIVTALVSSVSAAMVGRAYVQLSGDSAAA